jgi:hypothetical protein
MASAEPGRRVEKVVGYPQLSEMGAPRDYLVEHRLGADPRD